MFFINSIPEDIEHHLLERKGLLSARVGNTFSFAEREMKNINGINQTHKVKYANTWKHEESHR